ncbi:prolyl 3-hydroxylase 2 [Arapaima gigas]
MHLILCTLFLCYLAGAQEEDETVANWDQKQKSVKNSEVPPHQEAFKAAMVHYRIEDFQKAIKDLELALVGYYRADGECRARCDGPQAFKAHSPVHYRTSLLELVADHYSQVLRCKHECVRDLATWPDHSSPIEDYLPLHYAYLQFSYFKTARFQEALESALTYLLFHPGEKVMMDNAAYYQAVLGRKAEPHEDADWYLRRHRAERQLLLFAGEQQGGQSKPVNYWNRPGENEDAER